MAYRTVLFIILFLLAFVAGAIFFAAGPGYSSKEFAAQGIHQLDEYVVRTHSSTPNEITVVSYNMGYASAEKNNQAVELSLDEVVRNLDSMVAALKELDPDIVFLQEVDFRASRTFNINQMEYLARGLKMPFAAYVVTWNKRYVPWPYWPPNVHFGKMLSGQAILSRFPITDQDQIRFTKPKSNAFWYNWFYLDRVVQKSSLSVGDEWWDVWNIHLEAYDQDARLAQLKKLAAAIVQDPATTLATGDYNEEPGANLENYSQQTALKRTGLEIDYIFYSDKLKLVDDGHLSITASDHFPIWAKFKVNQ